MMTAYRTMSLAGVPVKLTLQSAQANVGLAVAAGAVKSAALFWGCLLMNTTATTRATWLVPLLLALAMLATRFHHFGIGTVLPDASVAVFFLLGAAGFGLFALVGFLALAFVIDAAAIGLANVPDVCVTWGYMMMAPAYGALWLAGRFVSGTHYAGFAGGARIGLALLAGVVGFFLLSNLGYYLGGGFAESHGFAGYWTTVAKYFPMYLKWSALYVVAGFVLAALAPRVLPARA
jgi:hypothetical protein